jgi:radical SAM protein with 4Fe4S-binding SPASM domain
MTSELTERIIRYYYLASSYIKFFMTGKALAYPLLIQIQTRSLCNAHCQFCPYPVVSKRLEQGTMTRELFTKIIDEVNLIKHSCTIVFELHNEPLLDERIFEFIKYVKSRNRKTKICLVTNGQLIDKFTLEEIREAEIDQLIISLNAHTPEMYQKLNCGLDYDRIINNIHSLISEERLKRVLTISFVLNREAAKEIPLASDYWKKTGVKTRIIKLENRAGALTNYELLMLKSNYARFSVADRIGKYLIARTLDITGCYDPFFHMNIMFNGDVILCCDDWNRSTIVGNIRDKTIRQVWNSPPMNEARRLILKKNYDQISSCKKCSKAK